MLLDHIFLISLCNSFICLGSLLFLSPNCVTLTTIKKQILKRGFLSNAFLKHTSASIYGSCSFPLLAAIFAELQAWDGGFSPSIHSVD